MERVRRVIIVAIAAAIMGSAGSGTAWLVATRPAPARSAETARPLEVLVQETALGVFDAPVIGYGTVRPKNQINVVPQVSGTLTDMNPQLAVGNTISQGDLLFEIDPRPYESQVLQVKADIKLLEVQLERQRQEEKNLTVRLENASAQLNLTQGELDRDVELAKTNAASDAEVDISRQRYLQAKDKVLAYEAQLALIPHLVDEIEARLEARRAALADAERNVAHTKITCPFDARVDGVSAKKAQVVVANLAIAVLTDLEAFELAAVLDPSDLRWTDSRAYARALGGDIGEPPAVTVTWTLQGQRYSWTGHVARLERHDEATRTARLVVEIPNSLAEVTAERARGKPQLSIGMFCKAEIPAEPLPGALVVPRSAIREDNAVYVFEPDPASPDGLTGRLAVRRVPVLRTVGGEALVDFVGRREDQRLPVAQAAAVCELRPGDRIVTSPLSRPVLGMKLRLRQPEPAALAWHNPAEALSKTVAQSDFEWGFVQHLRSPLLSILPLDVRQADIEVR